MSGTVSYKKGKAWVILLITMCTACTSLLLQNCSNQSKETQEKSIAAAEYTGDASCAGCHSSEHKDWLTSHHYMAMLTASDTTVLGDFNNATLTSDGVTSSFFKKEGKYFINTEGDDGQNHDYEVKYTFGFYPLQQYLVEFPGGRMQVPRVSWDAKAKKWYHQYAGMQIPAHDWLHWTGNSQNWNAMCASCHSTNLQKGYDWNTDTYNTTYNIVNVSCESCHGPGSRHIELVSSSDYKKGTSGQSTFMLLGKNSSQTDIVNTCGVCHARKTDITGAVNPGKEFLDDFIPQTPTTEYFHADGQMDDEVYNYTSFLQSKMHKRGVKCTDCHNPHSGKVMPGNISCGKCHEPSKYDAETHTFHKSGTAASECKSCHMYAKEYMGNDLRHDHSFRIPRPDLTAKYGSPNTCNSCHSNKSPQWAASAIVRWYGPKRRYHFSENLIPGSRLDEASFTHLQRLLNDTAVPSIIHATAAEYLGSIPSEESLQTLLQLLNRSEPHVRYRALRSLETFDASLWISAVTPLLNDPVRAVRIAAATLTSGLSAEQIPAASQKVRQDAEAELEKYVLYQTDFAAGNSLAGDYYTRKQSYSVAEKYYLRAIGMDDQMNYARLNLSAVLSSQGKNNEALKVLNDAIRIDPSSERAYYNKALLLAEMNDLNGAAESFDKAVSLNSRNTRVYYNYGIILQQLKRFEQAESILLKGITLDPNNGDLNYSLCLLYLNTGQKEKAKQPITVLLQYHYDNPAYAEITNRFSVKK